MSTTSLLLVAIFAITGVLSGDPEVHYNATQLITSKGYPAEEHYVTTSDGYILGMQRIPHGKNDKTNKTRPVFFLQHGLLCSSTNWLTNLETESLAYILADNGYDVWLGNVRGNTYSRAHISLKPTDKRFWQFSFDEHALIDLPTMLDHIISVTGQKKIFYVGHSQGTMMGFAGFTHNKTLASYIEKFYALAPVSTVQYIEGLFGYIARHYEAIAWVLERTSNGEFFPNNEFIVELGKAFCHSEVDVVCTNVLFLICGFDENNVNSSRIQVYLAHTPAATSLQNVIHWAQMVNSGNFQMYNYSNPAQNKLKYNQTVPPFYDVTQLSVPTYLFTGDKDYLADPKDVARLISNLTPLGDKLQKLDIAKYEHLDFIWATDANKLVYDVIIEDAKKMADKNN